MIEVDTYYEIHYGPKPIKDREIRRFRDYTPANHFYREKSKTMHCNVFLVEVGTRTKRMKLI